MLLVFKYKTEKESFEKQKLLLKSLGVQQCVSKGNAWVMFTIYWLFMNAKKTICKDLKLMSGVILHMFYIEERTFSIQTELQSVS